MPFRSTENCVIGVEAFNVFCGGGGDLPEGSFADPDEHGSPFGGGDGDGGGSGLHLWRSGYFLPFCRFYRFGSVKTAAFGSFLWLFGHT